MKKTILILIIGAISFFSIMFLFQKEEKEEMEKITIVSSLFPYYDIAKEIGKDKVNVSLLLPPNTEVHSFEPKTGDFIKINNADIFIYTGNFMEPWAERIIESVDSKEIIIIKASKGIELLEDEDKEEDHQYDPHIWLDIENVKNIAKKITETLIIASPEDEQFFTKNTNDYIIRLEKMDNAFAQSLENCKSREIIYTSHYAFAYFAKRYDLKHSSILGISHDTEPTINSLISVIEKIKNEKIDYIFYEEFSDPKIANVITEETGAKMLSLNPLENLSKEEMEKEISFLDIMEKNIENLKIGLKCN